ncbi:uncharacterized protein BN726_01182 [Clostridium sp. CAG:594]|nr:uncharacterized protein BN726_01182 [Clostridium sp. CAG:594]
MKQIAKMALKMIIISVSIFLILYMIYYKFIYDFDDLPKGIYVKSIVSPNENYKLNIYKISYGMTMDWFMRVELENVGTKEKKNIYYDYHLKDNDIKWLDNKNISINKVKLNVQKETYDGRMHFH